jgi:hypothetical protein
MTSHFTARTESTYLYLLMYVCHACSPVSCEVVLQLQATHLTYLDLCAVQRRSTTSYLVASKVICDLPVIC